MSKLKRIQLARVMEPIPLPDDLIIEILLRLPVPSILRFSSVCREWCFILRSQRFIDDHTRFHQDDAMSRLIVFWSRARIRGYDIKLKNYKYGYSSFHDGTLSKRHKVDRGKIPWKVSAVRGPCNGILCLLTADSKRMVFWNPTTRTMRQVRECPIQMADYFDFGFGIDPLTSDLKIVVISLCNSTSSQKFASAVYNSRNALWRLIIDESVYDHGSRVWPNLCGCTFSNGFCYWVKKSQPKSSLLEFDTRTDSFQEIEMPKIPSRCDEVTLDLYNGVLALLTYRAHNGDRCVVDIWLMKEREHWTKLPTVFMPFEILPPIGICESNKIFARKWTNQLGLIVYDPVSGDTRDLGFERENDHGYHVITCPYKESLARL